ncbi:MAG: hypothetical protein WA484_00220 [Solirubrobacteraceae bacterium]
MKPTQATSWITEARFEPYLAEADGDHERAVALYVWNARVSAAMFETLHHVEVALRNVIDAQFDLVVASAPVSSTWLCDPTILNEASRTRVEETAARIRREGHLATRARVVAGLAFGFWRALFDKRYDRLWVSHLHRAFPGGSGDRSEVAALMSTLVPFRNRLAHHETIIRRPLAGHYDDMLKLATLIDPDARVWIEKVSRVSAVLGDRP